MRISIAERRRYRLSDHVRACVHDGQVILLDLRRNRYLGIGGTQLAALDRIIEGWPNSGGATSSQLVCTDVDACVQALAAQGMLIDSDRPCLPPAPHVEPLENVDVGSDSLGTAFGWRRPLNLVQSATAAALWLRRLNLAQIEARVRRLRRPSDASSGIADVEDLRSAVASYVRLRPLLFTVHDRCLFDSLTLIGFLAREGIPARWVVGVRTRPFAAHSWAQSGHLVLNDVREHVGTYTPILVV